jgi:hypothetical protein
MPEIVGGVGVGVLEEAGAEGADEEDVDDEEVDDEDVGDDEVDDEDVVDDEVDDEDVGDDEVDELDDVEAVDDGAELVEEPVEPTLAGASVGIPELLSLLPQAVSRTPLMTITASVE